MTLSADLTALFRLLSDPVRWSKDEFSRDAYGDPCRASGEPAECWCITEALKVVAPLTHDGKSHARRDAMVRAVWASIQALDKPRLQQFGASQGIISFNDHPSTSHADVLEVLAHARGA